MCYDKRITIGRKQNPIRLLSLQLRKRTHGRGPPSQAGDQTPLEKVSWPPLEAERLAGAWAGAGLQLPDEEEANLQGTVEPQPAGWACGHVEGVKWQCRRAPWHVQCLGWEGHGKMITRPGRTARSLEDLLGTWVGQSTTGCLITGKASN